MRTLRVFRWRQSNTSGRRLISFLDTSNTSKLVSNLEVSGEGLSLCGVGGFKGLGFRVQGVGCGVYGGLVFGHV